MKENDQIAIGKRIKAIRERLGFTQPVFASHLNVSGPTVSDVELGKTRVGTEMLFNMAVKFNIDIYYVLFGEGEPFRSKIKSLHSLLEERYFGDWTEDILEMIYHMKMSKMYLSGILNYSKQYYYRNRDIITEEEKDFLEKSKGLTQSNAEIDPETKKEKKPTPKKQKKPEN